MDLKTGEFDAKSEDGRRFHIIISPPEKIDASSKDGVGYTSGRRQIFTTDGHHCIPIDDDTFEIVELGLKVKRI